MKIMETTFYWLKRFPKLLTVVLPSEVAAPSYVNHLDSSLADGLWSLKRRDLEKKRVFGVGHILQEVSVSALKCLNHPKPRIGRKHTWNEGRFPITNK